MVFGVITGLLLSCASKPPANSLGEVQARFESSVVLLKQSKHEQAMMNEAGRAIASSNSDARRAGAAAAGAGLLSGLIRDTINSVIRARLTKAAREALLETAKGQHGEDIDIKKIRFALIGQNQQTGLYQYTASGFAVPPKE